MNNSKKTRVSISIDMDTEKRIRALAKDSRRNFSNYVNMILDDHLKEIDHGKDY